MLLKELNMQDIDHQLIQLYEAFSYLISFVSLVMFSVAAFVVYVNGRSSTERTLIGIGAVLQAISVVLSLGMSLLQRVIHQGGFGQTTFLFYGISHLLSFVGVALGLYGAVKLLHRAGQMELLLQDSDDDR